LRSGEERGGGMNAGIMPLKVTGESDGDTYRITFYYDLSGQDPLEAEK